MAYFRIELECESPDAARRAFRAFADIGVASGGPTTEQWPDKEPKTDSKAIAILEAEDQQAVEVKLRGLVGGVPRLIAIDEIGKR